MRNKICLLGTKDILRFMGLIENVKGKIEVYNPNTGYRVSANSLLGLIMATTEWGGNTWIESENDIYELIKDYVIVADNDCANIHS